MVVCYFNYAPGETEATKDVAEGEQDHMDHEGSGLGVGFREESLAYRILRLQCPKS